MKGVCKSYLYKAVVTRSHCKQERGRGPETVHQGHSGTVGDCYMTQRHTHGTRTQVALQSSTISTLCRTAPDLEVYKDRPFTYISRTRRCVSIPSRFPQHCLASFLRWSAFVSGGTSALHFGAVLQPSSCSWHFIAADASAKGFACFIYISILLAGERETRRG